MRRRRTHGTAVIIALCAPVRALTMAVPAALARAATTPNWLSVGCVECTTSGHSSSSGRDGSVAIGEGWPRWR